MHSPRSDPTLVTFRVSNGDKLANSPLALPAMSVNQGVVLATPASYRSLKDVLGRLTAKWECILEFLPEFTFFPH